MPRAAIKVKLIVLGAGGSNEVFADSTIKFHGKRRSDKPRLYLKLQYILWCISDISSEDILQIALWGYIRYFVITINDFWWPVYEEDQFQQQSGWR